MDKLIITAALVGGRNFQGNRRLTFHSAPAEIGKAAEEARNAGGASIVHLHVRDEEGKPTQDIEVFRKTIEEDQKRTRRNRADLDWRRSRNSD